MPTLKVEMSGGDGEGEYHLLNTSSVGIYPELVRLREKREKRWGKWPAFAVALVITLRRSEPLRIQMDGHERKVWFVFIGNGPYHPRGALPAWRSKLDSGLLDVRWLRADVRFSRIRAVVALLLAALGHSRVYAEQMARELEIELPEPEPLACDGEVVGEARRLRYSIASSIAVYRRDEDNPRWADRERPHHPQ
jgi:undecaprenyl-diphosphatase